MRPLRALVRSALDALPYVGRLRTIVRQGGAFPPGHFYSPIPAQAEVQRRLATTAPNGDLPGIDLRTDAQCDLLRAFADYYPALPFPHTPTPETRYYFDQIMFCYADAIFLYSFLRQMQPRRIVEVGSGYSTCVMLDTIDRHFTTPPAVTLIEPFPVSVRRLFRPSDFARVTLIEDQAQRVPLETFTALQSGDLLFIDSSHVLKCGSDLQYLLFDIIPRLAVGVYVHFHDVFDGFEYPQDWLDQGIYYNEDYALRAFLSFNRAWEVVLFAPYVLRVCHDWAEAHMPLCLRNTGGSLYLRRIG